MSEDLWAVGRAADRLQGACDGRSYRQARRSRRGKCSYRIVHAGVQVFGKRLLLPANPIEWIDTAELTV